MVLEVIPKCPSKQRLRNPEAVPLRGVEEIHTELPRLADRSDRFVLVELAHSPPSCQVPKAIGETSRSVIPSVILLRVAVFIPPPSDEFG